MQLHSLAFSAVLFSPLTSSEWLLQPDVICSLSVPRGQALTALNVSWVEVTRITRNESNVWKHWEIRVTKGTLFGFRVVFKPHMTFFQHGLHVPVKMILEETSVNIYLILIESMM